MNGNIAVIFAAAAAIAALIPSGVEGRVAGGYEPEPNSVPWIVNIRVDNFRPLCAGTILNAEWILTTAWCSDEKYPTELYEVIAGDHDVHRDVIEPTQQNRRVDRIILHPRYNNTNPGDFMIYNIRLMHVYPPLNLSDIVYPIQIGENPPCSLLSVSGWGELTQGGGYTSTLLHTVDDVPLIPFDICRDTYGANNITIADYNCCAGTDVKGWGTGDWGDPLTCNVSGTTYVYGIASHTLVLLDFDVYVNATYFKEWVEETISDLSPNCPPFDGHPVYFPGPSCDTYYVCTATGPSLRNCPRPLLWNQERQACEEPSTVVCETKSA